MFKMFKKVAIVFCFALFLPVSANAGQAHFIFDLKPMTVLFSPDIDGFYLERSSYYSYRSVEIDGVGSLVPTLNVGVGFDFKTGCLDATAGIGYLWNNVFSGTIGTVSLNYRFKLGRHVTLGPRVALVFSDDLDFDEDFGDDTDIRLSAEDGVQGAMFGLDFTAGGQLVAFHLTLDYVSLSPYKVCGLENSGWRASDDELDLSGFALSLGVIFRF